MSIVLKSSWFDIYTYWGRTPLEIVKEKGLEQVSDDKEILKIINEDYYYSNVIARASKTMFECKSAKTNLKSNGTEG